MDFKYERLSNSNDEIRVITLLPGHFEDVIVCEIAHCLHDENLSYEALSYTWGEPTNRQRIIIDGLSLWVTESLAIALRYLRLGEEARYIWIDAICINQSDTTERNAQVRRMASIYQRAKQVHVWLGPPDASSLLAMSFLKEIDAKVAQCIDDDAHLSHIQGWIVEHFRSPKNISVWEAIAQFWQRGYWTRIWIIQEVVFGTSIRFQCTVHCGKDFVVWETLEVLDRAMSSLDQKMIDNEHSNIDLLQISKGARLDISWFLAIHGEHTRNRELPLSYLLIRQGRYKATDPRDKVYALLSMVHESQADGLTVDYGLPASEVYMMALKEIVWRERKLGVLCACCRQCRRPISRLQLPSWCPDWSTDPMDDCCSARLWSYTKPIYSASGSLDAEAHFSSAQPVLSARGWFLDTISTLDVTLTPLGIPDANCLQFLRRGPENQISGAGNIVNTFTTHEAIWRTLVANRGISQDEPPASFQDAYETLRDETHTDEVEDVALYRDKVQACLRRRRLCKSTTGFLPGLVPETAIDGDLICILVGCALPIILRTVKDHYIIVGEAYIHGVMYGEILDMERNGEVERAIFDIH